MLRSTPPRQRRLKEPSLWHIAAKLASWDLWKGGPASVMFGRSLAVRHGLSVAHVGSLEEVARLMAMLNVGKGTAMPG